MKSIITNHFFSFTFLPLVHYFFVLFDRSASRILFIHLILFGREEFRIGHRLQKVGIECYAMHLQVSIIWTDLEGKKKSLVLFRGPRKCRGGPHSARGPQFGDHRLIRLSGYRAHERVNIASDSNEVCSNIASLQFFCTT